MAKRIVTRANCIVFFGPELCKSDQNPICPFTNLNSRESGLRGCCASISRRCLPCCRGLANHADIDSSVGINTPRDSTELKLFSSIAKLVTRRHRSSRAMYDFLYPVVNRRLQRRNIDEIQPQGEKPVCIHPVYTKHGSHD